MSGQSQAQVTAANLLAELVAAGVEHIFVAPGSRSQALAIAAGQLAQTRMANLHIVLDERSMGFQALGVARVTGMPVAVITTSGTAVANLHPAVLEAHHSSVPLILLTADRPVELRGVGANQTTEQIGMFGSSVVTCIELEAQPAETETSEVAGLARGAAVEAVHAALGYTHNELGIQHGGPVQINIGLREPLSALEPRADDLVHIGPWSHEIDFPQAQEVEIDLSKKTVIIAGDSASEEEIPDSIPIFAEPSSNLRWADESIVNYRNLLANQVSLLAEIEQLLVIGKPTLSREVQSLLRETNAKVFAIPGRHGIFNPTKTMTQVVSANFNGEPDAQWLERWQQASESIEIVADNSQLLTRRQIIEQVYAATGEEAALVLGASRMIREADHWAPRLPVQTYANRGLAGIDGTIGFATGVSMTGWYSQVRVLLGDLTAIHDAGSLAANQQELNLQVVIANDHGGRIFESLEVAKLLPSADFEQLFVTEQKVNFEALASAYDWNYQLVTNREELQKALELSGRVIIEARVER